MNMPQTIWIWEVIYASMRTRHLLSYPVSVKVYAVDHTRHEVLKSGKLYHYNLFGNMVRLSKLEEYNQQTCSWDTTEMYTRYNSIGNLLESIDANGLRTAYVWGYNGMYLVAKIENTYRANIDSIIGTSPLTGSVTKDQISSIKQICPAADITAYEYKPLVGISKITYPSGESLSYDYNVNGKLIGIYNSQGEKLEESLYSIENKQ